MGSSKIWCNSGNFLRLSETSESQCHVRCLRVFCLSISVGKHCIVVSVHDRVLWCWWSSIWASGWSCHHVGRASPGSKCCSCWESSRSLGSAVGNSHWCQASRKLAVVISLAVFLWIKWSIISVRAETYAREVSWPDFILSSTKPRENLMLFSSSLSVASPSASPVTSFSYADLFCALEPYKFPLPNVLNL